MPSLHNKDSQKYDIVIKTGGSSRNTNISGHTNSNGMIPSGKSTVSIKGGSSIESDGSKDIIIQNGKLSFK